MSLDPNFCRLMIYEQCHYSECHSKLNLKQKRVQHKKHFSRQVWCHLLNYHQNWVNFSNEAFTNTLICEIESFHFWIFWIVYRLHMRNIRYKARLLKASRLWIPWLLESWLWISRLLKTWLWISTTLWNKIKEFNLMKKNLTERTCYLVEDSLAVGILAVDILLVVVDNLMVDSPAVLHTLDSDYLDLCVSRKKKQFKN